MPRATSTGLGLRGNTPDGVPVLGPTPLTNLFVQRRSWPGRLVNVLRLRAPVADAITGEKPAIDIAGLELNRFQ